MKRFCWPRDFNSVAIRLSVVSSLLFLLLALATMRANADEIGRVLPAWEMQAAAPASVKPSLRVRGRAVRANYAQSSDLVSEARRFLGSGRMAGMPSRWCGAFLALVARRTGHSVPASPNIARTWVSAGPHVAARPGTLMVMKHHIGVVVGVDGPVITLLSGNHGHRVAIGHYEASRALAFVALR